MFKHILISTDGSKLAAKGVKAGVKLAKALGAKITAAYVIPLYSPPMYGEAVVYVPGVSPQEYRQISEKAARKALAAVEIEARTAGVRCATQRACQGSGSTISGTRSSPSLPRWA